MWRLFLSRNIEGRNGVGQVSELDDGVGRVMGALADVGMAENTLTIFSTGEPLAVCTESSLNPSAGLSLSVLCRQWRTS